MDISPGVSARIGLLRFPLIVGVVFIHTFHQGRGVFFGDGTIAYNGDALSVFTQFLFSEVLARIAVPLFFIISGVLLFKDFSLTKECYKKKVSSRVSTVLVPYLLWNIAVILLRLSAEFMPNASVMFSGRQKLVSDYSLLDLVSDFAWSPASYQFWFLRDLFIAVLLSPLFYMAAKRLGLSLFFVFCVLWFADFPRYVLNLDWKTLVFIYLACWICVYQWDLERLDSKSKVIIPAYCCLAVVVASLYTYLFLNNSESILVNVFARGVILLGGVAVWCATKYALGTNLQRVLLILAPFSFFVYAAHEPMMTIVRKLVYRWFPPSNSLQVIFYYFLLPTAVVTFLVLVALLLRKVTPRPYALLTGGRVDKKVAHTISS